MKIKPSSYFCYNHQHKADRYVLALRRAGFSIAPVRMAKVILMDVDIAGRVNPIRSQLARGESRLFTYPHAARANVAWDGFWLPSRYTSATFVAASGHVDILRAYGYTKPLHVAGWAYCDMIPFRPIPDPRRVLFAPIHPTRRGFLSELDRKINRAAYERLLKLVDRNEIELSVRYIRGLANNGLWHDQRVHFIEGNTDLTYADIDAADVVVSHQTFAYISIARGKPTIMMSEETPPRNGGSEDTFEFVRSWDKYKDLLMYPLDILVADDTMGLIHRAASTDCDIADWRTRNIGSPFDESAVVETVRSYL